MPVWVWALLIAALVGALVWLAFEVKRGVDAASQVTDSTLGRVLLAL